MRIAIRDEHLELVQKMELQRRHAMVDHQAAYDALEGAFSSMIMKNDIDLIDEPWLKYQTARDNANNQTNGLWAFLHEHYPQTRSGRWSLHLKHMMLYRDELSELIADVNRQSAQLYPGTAASGAEPAAA